MATSNYDPLGQLDEGPRGPATIGSMLHDIETARDRLDKALAGIDDIQNALGGRTDKAMCGETTAPQAVPNGMIAEGAHGLRGIHATIDRIETALARLSNLVR